MFNNPVLEHATGLLQMWRQATRPDIPGIADGVGVINPGRGNLKVILAPPDEGPAVGAVALVYNSQSPADGEVGWGWTISPKFHLT